MKRVVLILLASVLLSGCAMMLKSVRAKENNGAETVQPPRVVWMAADKLLQSRGYATSKEKLFKGADSDGMTIYGTKVSKEKLQDIGTGAATNLALGMLGAKSEDQHLKVGSAEVVEITIVKKWDEGDWNSWSKDKMYVVNTIGYKADKDSKGRYYNRTDSSEMDMLVLQKQILAYAVRVAPYAR